MNNLTEKERRYVKQALMSMDIRACLHMYHPFMYNERKAPYKMGRGKPTSNQKLANLRIDFAFKQLFSTSGNEGILRAFLNAMLQSSLKSPIVSLQLEDPQRINYRF